MKLLFALHHYDVQMFLRLVNARLHGQLQSIFQPISKTANGPLYLLVVLLAAWQQGADSPFVRAVLLAFLLERPLYYLLKNTLKRNRPQAALPDFKSLIVPHDQFSFPSGHTCAAFMMATLASHFWPVLLLPLYLWATAVGFARVVLGVHFPGDVLAGALMGISIAFLSLQWMVA